MTALSDILRTNLVPPRVVWLAEGVGAAVAASVAFACDGDLWLVGLTATVVAFGLAASSVDGLARQLRGGGRASRRS